MHINAPVLGEQISHQRQPLVDHRDEGIRAHVEGRVNVDQLEAALPFDFLAEGAVLQR